VADAQEWGPLVPHADGDRRLARPPRPPEDFLSINGAMFGTVQWLARSDVAQGRSYATGSVDLTVTLRPSDTFRIFIDMEGFAGPGPDQKLGTLGRVNKKAEDLEGKGETLKLMKVVFRPSWFDEAVMLSFGKLDVEDYFDRNFMAEDEETQFLNGALNGNPMLKQPENGLAATLRLKWGEWRYAFGVHALGDVDSDMSGVPFIISEIGRRNIFPLLGHYRFRARVSSQLDDRDRLTWGSGISIDQLLTSELGVFVRAGFSRDEGRKNTGYAWSAGLQFTPIRFGRDKDALGIGYSHQQDVDGRERLAELYYRYTASDWLAFSAGVQWIISGPNTVTGGTNRDVVVPSLRALISF
jgi:high affinity Mn2+ porin